MANIPGKKTRSYLLQLYHFYIRTISPCFFDIPALHTTEGDLSTTTISPLPYEVLVGCWWLSCREEKREEKREKEGKRREKERKRRKKKRGEREY